MHFYLFLMFTKNITIEKKIQNPLQFWKREEKLLYIFIAKKTL